MSFGTSTWTAALGTRLVLGDCHAWTVRVCVGDLLCRGRSSAGGRTNECPSPLSAEVVAAWREADASSAGWAEHGFLSGVSPRRGGQGRGSANFRVRTSVEGRVLAKLPSPEHPFGLLLSYANVTDAGLKELAGLKLQNLVLYETKVTDAGLKELGGLKSLQSLDLGWTQLTDLKELGGLNSLQSLSVSGTKVTNAGLKGLAGLESLQWLDLRYRQ